MKTFLYLMAAMTLVFGEPANACEEWENSDQDIGCAELPEWAHGFNFGNQRVAMVVLFALRGETAYTEAPLRRLAALPPEDQVRIADLYFSDPAVTPESDEEGALVEELRVPAMLLELAMVEAQAAGTRETATRRLIDVLQDLRQRGEISPPEIRALHRYVPQTAGLIPSLGLSEHLVERLDEAEALLAETERFSRNLDRAIQLLSDRFGDFE